MNPRVFWQDERLLAVDKPAGQPVIPGRGAAAPSLRDRLAESLGAPVFVVHRLDRDTSGIVLFAKDAEAHRFLSMAFEHRRVAKEYIAAVQGRMEEAEGVSRQPLREAGSGRVKVDPAGKPSVTRYATLARSERHSLLKVQPETGRRHQIRVHLYDLGHPVLGDPTYGPAPRPVGGAGRLLLHAFALAFTHPDGQARRLQCPPGDDFRDCLRIVTDNQISYLEKSS